jgi:hypothetical protein
MDAGLLSRKLRGRADRWIGMAIQRWLQQGDSRRLVAQQRPAFPGVEAQLEWPREPRG